MNRGNLNRLEIAITIVLGLILLGLLIINATVDDAHLTITIRKIAFDGPTPSNRQAAVDR